jgi:lipopolysaccharide export system permease protein
LWSSIHALEARGQDAARQRFAFWSGLARLAALPLAMLLALPLLLGALRKAGSGARATLGLGLGLLYFILQRTVESGAVAFGLDPLLLAWLPTLLLALAVALLLQRTRRISAA